MNTCLFSIIIPVYNDEKNIHRCINSVLSQDFQNFECLIINDGSIDNCASICDEYASNDKRLHVFHKKNEGVSQTRQFGINHAKGDYSFFLDSDDWIEPFFLSAIYEKLVKNKVDILFMDFFEETSAGKEKYVVQNPFSTDIETIIRLVLEGKLYSCLWNVVINKYFYSINKINFTKNINYGEDTLFILEMLLNNPIIGYLEESFYHHTFNHVSFTRINKKEKYHERILFLNHLSFFLEKYGRNDLIKHNFFPMNDKYEMLCSLLFTKKEYHSLFSLEITFYYLKKYGLKKYLVLKIAETHFYQFLVYLIVFYRNLKKKKLNKYA